MSGGDLPSALLDTLARHIHEDYRRRRGAERAGHERPGHERPGPRLAGRDQHGDPDDAALVPWEELPEALRASNRAQARDIEQKLASLGYELAAREGDGAPLVLREAEVESLARAEHTRFVEERVAAGWRRGAQRDAAARTSPTLVGWEQLSEVERDLDRDAVRLIPALLASSGLRAIPRRD